MALISCPKCGKQISDKAIKCPRCGWQIYGNINCDGKNNSNSKAEVGKRTSNERVNIDRKSGVTEEDKKQITKAIIIALILIYILASKTF